MLQIIKFQTLSWCYCHGRMRLWGIQGEWGYILHMRGTQISVVRERGWWERPTSPFLAVVTTALHITRWGLFLFHLNVWLTSRKWWKWLMIDAPGLASSTLEAHLPCWDKPQRTERPGRQELGSSSWWPHLSSQLEASTSCLSTMDIGILDIAV